jgi:hypothetical protein
VQKANIMAAAFHPELTSDTTVHRRFLEMANAATQSNGPRSRPAPKRPSSKPAKPKRKR